VITRAVLDERVREWGLRDDVVEKDYVLGWLLWGIGANKLLSLQQANVVRVKTARVNGVQRSSDAGTHSLTENFTEWGGRPGWRARAAKRGPGEKSWARPTACSPRSAPEIRRAGRRGTGGSDELARAHLALRGRR
jgi:hypothetical protein